MDLNFDGKHDYKDEHLLYYVYRQIEKEESTKEENAVSQRTFANRCQTKSMGWGMFIVLIVGITLIAVKTFFVS